jgi:L-lactate dehydrogenase complex protein LldG
MDTSNEGKANLFQNLFKSIREEEDKRLTPSFRGPSTAEDLDLRFAENFSASSGKFVYCENLQTFALLLESLKEENHWNFVFSWNPVIKKILDQFDFQNKTIGFFMDNSDAAISDCFGILANEGVVMLTPNQATNRRLTSFPPHHILIANRSHLFENLDLAIESFQKEYYDKLPSLVELNKDRKVCKANHARLLNAEGTANVYVFYIDVDDFG